MPTIKPASAFRLHGGDQIVARIAGLARGDTIMGGCSALLRARRLAGMGSRNPVLEAVSDIYSRSSGKHSPKWEAWECGECGSVHLGEDAAMACCSPSFED